MKLAPLGALTTAIVIVVGIILVIPAYTQRQEPAPILLSFAVAKDNGLGQWCSGLVDVLKNHRVKATLFMSGKTAEAYPQCAKEFSNLGLDVGSETYSYTNLTSIRDYTIALQEVHDGKAAVDSASGVYSRLFHAPYSSTDDNVYSILQRSGIGADFSYVDHYNTYENNQFVRHPLKRIENPPPSQKGLDRAFGAGMPVLIEFDTSVPVEDIDRFISELKTEAAGHDARIIGVSDLVKLELVAVGIDHDGH